MSRPLLLRAYALLAHAGRRLREVPGLHHEVSLSLAERCERLAAECLAAVAPPTPRAPDGPGDADALANEGRG